MRDEVDNAHGRATAAVATLLHAARCGDAAAQAVLGQLYAEGRGVVRDGAEALHWYRVAASSGDAASANMVGRCHELGQGVPVDFGLAATWYRKAAQAGSEWGMYNVAHLLATGRGVALDRAAALRWYRAAAQLGHAKSMNFVGRYLEEGWECSRDPDAAFEWYRRAADGGDFRGQASYASALADRGRIGEALRWLERAFAGGTPAFRERLDRDLAASGHPALREFAHSAGRAQAGVDGC